jgi:hypothetical protein
MSIVKRFQDKLKSKTCIYSVFDSENEIWGEYKPKLVTVVKDETNKIIKEVSRAPQNRIQTVILKSFPFEYIDSEQKHTFFRLNFEIKRVNREILEFGEADSEQIQNFLQPYFETQYPTKTSESPEIAIHIECWYRVNNFHVPKLFRPLEGGQNNAIELKTERKDFVFPTNTTEVWAFDKTELVITVQEEIVRFLQQIKRSPNNRIQQLILRSDPIQYVNSEGKTSFLCCQAKIVRNEYDQIEFGHIDIARVHGFLQPYFSTQYPEKKCEVSELNIALVCHYHTLNSPSTSNNQ